jgi:hypothetical protein
MVYAQKRAYLNVRSQAWQYAPAPFPLLPTPAAADVSVCFPIIWLQSILSLRASVCFRSSGVDALRRYDFPAAFASYLSLASSRSFASLSLAFLAISSRSHVFLKSVSPPPCVPYAPALPLMMGGGLTISQANSYREEHSTIRIEARSFELSEKGSE